MKLILGMFLLFSWIEDIYAYSFKDAVKALESHAAVDSIKEQSLSLKEEGELKGSWGDPKFSIAAKNFPKDSLEKDETPMTGVEFGVSQTIALTTKYGNIEDAFAQMSKMKEFEAEDKRRELMRALWIVLIENRKLSEEVQILQENISWIDKILDVSKKLYTNGKISQQALLDIQIRKSELEASLSNKQYDQKKQLDRMGYILGFEDQLELSSVPWELIDKDENNPMDVKELGFRAQLQAKEHLLTASKLAYVPDITVSVGYTKRENIDGIGDFVSAMVSFPLPFSGSKYAGNSQAVHEKLSAQKSLRNYKQFKESQRLQTTHEIEKIQRELKILTEKTIKFAENSRTVTSKSYSLGNSTYIELLQSELKLQNILLQNSTLKSNLAKEKINYKYLVGENLYE